MMEAYLIRGKRVPPQSDRCIAEVADAFVAAYEISRKTARDLEWFMEEVQHRW